MQRGRQKPAKVTYLYLCCMCGCCRKEGQTVYYVYAARKFTLTCKRNKINAQIMHSIYALIYMTRTITITNSTEDIWHLTLW